MSEDKLTRDDLVLLMESYRNMITMHQAILDQTTKTIERMDTIATKQDSLFSKQGQICHSLESITSGLEGVNTNLSNCNTNIKTLDDSVSKQINEFDKRAIDNQGKLVNKIHLGWIGMGTIILGLIGLIMTLSQYIKLPPLP